MRVTFRRDGGVEIIPSGEITPEMARAAARLAREMKDKLASRQRSELIKEFLALPPEKRQDWLVSKAARHLTRPPRRGESLQSWWWRAALPLVPGWERAARRRLIELTGGEGEMDDAG